MGRHSSEFTFMIKQQEKKNLETNLYDMFKTPAL